MGSCREILTLQIGNYANWVGSHLWSLQEMTFNYDEKGISDLCHDVLFREGLNIRNEVTYTPRVICIEKKKSAAPVPTLQDDFLPPVPIWEPNLVDQATSSESHHQFIKDLDAGVDVVKNDYMFETTARGWGDFLRSRLHSRSILFNYTKFEDELEDRIRLYVEESDNLQGFHLITDATEYFPEISSFLEDEFPTKIRLSFPVLPFSGAPIRKDADTKIVQLLRNLSDSASFSSLTVPLSCIAELTPKAETALTFPHLLYNSENLYQSSAILASFLESVTIPYRTVVNPLAMSDVLASLTSRGWKFSGGNLSLPFAVPPATALKTYLETRNDETPLWSNVAIGADSRDAWHQTFTLRGFPDGEIFLQYLQFLSSSVSEVCSVTSPMSTQWPFPRIFSPHVSMKGSVDPTAERAPGFQVASVPVLAGLFVGPGIGDMLFSLSNVAKRVDIRTLSGIEMEEDIYAGILEDLNVWAKDHSLQMDID